MLIRYIARTVTLYHRHSLLIYVIRQNNSGRGFQTLANGLRQQEKSRTEITPRSRNEDTSAVSVGQKVATATKNAGYLGFSMIGFGLIAAIVYGIYLEMFSSESPQVVYSKTLSKYKNDGHVISILGTPIHGHGRDHYNRHARRNAPYFILTENGVQIMRISFIMQGPANRAKVTVELRENKDASFWQDKWEITYGALKTELGRMHVIEDHRGKYKTDNIKTPLDILEDNE